MEEELQTQLDECKKQAEEYLNGWKRAKADLINFQKQTEKEKEEWMEFLHANTIKSFLPVLDSMESANRGELGIRNEELGIARIHEQLKSVLKSYGVQEIITIGQPLNPEFHEVVGKESVEDKAPGLIIKEIQKGYLLNNRVLRPAKVIISE